MFISFSKFGCFSAIISLNRLSIPLEIWSQLLSVSWILNFGLFIMVQSSWILWSDSLFFIDIWIHSFFNLVIYSFFCLVISIGNTLYFDFYLSCFHFHGFYLCIVVKISSSLYLHNYSSATESKNSEAPADNLMFTAASPHQGDQYIEILKSTRQSLTTHSVLWLLSSFSKHYGDTLS